MRRSNAIRFARRGSAPNKSFKPNNNRYAIVVGLILVLGAMSRFIAALILALLPFGIGAKCQYDWYQVTGTVSDAQGPISGAAIVAHWSDGAGAHTAKTRSKHGHYKLELPFQSLSGPGAQPGQDSCTATLSSATITVSAQGFYSAKRSVSFLDHKGTWVVALRRKDGT